VLEVEVLEVLEVVEVVGVAEGLLLL